MDIKKFEKEFAPEYFRYWNSSEQARIDEDIERNRKADLVITPSGVRPGMKVRAVLKRHDFIFGCHIFNFNQLGSHELNEKHQALYGTLFNSATAAFYWQPFEPEEGKMRFETSERDTEEYWNDHKDPKADAFWRRPSTDQIVEFCERKKIRCHGHPLVWSNTLWHYPRWLMEKLPKSVLVQFLTDLRCGANIWQRGAEELDKLCPGFADWYMDALENRFRALSERYGARVASWDVCNESALDFSHGFTAPGKRLTFPCSLCAMPGDYTFQGFKLAEKYFPDSVKKNINDYVTDQAYADQITELQQRGAKIDIAGLQMHRMAPQQSLDIASGTTADLSPEYVRTVIGRLEKTGLPVHISEITFTAVDNSERGQAIQALMTRNLYRLWFSLKPVMGITWWNPVDDCGAPREPSVSGFCTKRMEPKPAFHVLDHLINSEWKTDVELTADGTGAVKFRGFPGTYELFWKDESGRSCRAEYHALESGK